ncbi:MAG: hypothetical protein ACJAXA_001220 [Candidatus Aldehydirespiratoraceae bacterium]|jgi:hypothetical protein
MNGLGHKRDECVDHVLVFGSKVARSQRWPELAQRSAFVNVGDAVVVGLGSDGTLSLCVTLASLGRRSSTTRERSTRCYSATSGCVVASRSRVAGSDHRSEASTGRLSREASFVRNGMRAPTKGQENDGAAVFAKPVTDWMSDWDWLDDQWGSDAIDIWNAVRAVTPMAMTERYGRALIPVTMEAVSAIGKDTENFSSQWVSVAQPDAIRRPAPPITSDPPHHQGHRRLLLPSFSPKKIEPMEVELREFCRGLIADLDGRDMADAAAECSQHIPVHGIAQMIGVPDSDAPVFRDWIYRNFQLARVTTGSARRSPPTCGRTSSSCSARVKPSRKMTSPRLSLKLRAMENRSIESCSSAICSF